VYVGMKSILLGSSKFGHRTGVRPADMSSVPGTANA